MQPPARPRARSPAVLVWFAATWTVLALLGADVFYKVDGADLIRLHVENGDHPWHVGYLPLLAAFARVLEWLGLAPSLLRLGTLFSATGMAAGIAFFHAGLRQLDTPRAMAHCATLLLAINPAALLFGAVVEFHGPMMAAAGAAFWWTCVQARRPTWWGMLVLGALTHGAFLLHSSGLLLPGWLLPLLLARRWHAGTRARDVQMAVLAGAVHTVLWFALPRLFGGFYGWHGDLEKAYAMETSIGRPQSLDYLPEIFVQEWLLPLLPVSLACWVAARRRALRPELVAFAIGLLPFLYLCVRQLVFEPEFGAYLLPLVPGAALLSAAAVPARVWPLLAVLSLVAAGVVRRQALPPELAARYEAFTDDLRQAAAGRPFLVLVGGHGEMAMAYARLPPERFLWLRSQATLPREHYGPEVWQASAAPLRGLHAAGHAVLLTAGARAWLADPAAMRMAEKPALEFRGNETMAGPLFLADLERGFRLEPAAGPPDAPAVFRVVPR